MLILACSVLALTFASVAFALELELLVQAGLISGQFIKLLALLFNGLFQLL